MNQKENKHYFGWSLEERDPKTIEELMQTWAWFYDHYFHVKTDGWENIPEGQVLLVGSHNGGLAAPDMIMMMYDWFRRFGRERLVYGLMHPSAWIIYQPIASLIAKSGAIRANPHMAIAALEKGASVLVYPGGAQDVFRPYWQRDQIEFAGRRGFIKLALRQQVPIVPLISKGAHDTIIVLAELYQQVKQLHEWGLFPWLFDLDPQVFPIYLGIPWLLAIGPLPNFPLPSKIHTRVCRPIIFERYGQQAAGDRHYVNQCYHRVVNEMQKELDILYAQD
jgi:1-acyl-sn-glycerol-3-phosphate acyltransferase